MPITLADREFLISPFRAGKTMRDVEGRYLGEGNAPIDPSMAAPIEWRSCPYAGSRHDHRKPMNVTALRQVTEHWEALLAFIAGFRGAYFSRFGGRVDAANVFDVTFMATMMPAYLVASRVCSADAIPVVVSAAYKTCSGVFQAVAHALLTRIAAGEPVSLGLSPQEIIAHADAHGVFMSAAGVCAAPPRMLDEFLRVLIDGDPATESGKLHHSAREFDGFFAFARAATALEHAKNVFGLATAYADSRLQQRLDRLAQADPDDASCKELCDRLAARSNRFLRALVADGNVHDVYQRVAGFVWSEVLRFGDPVVAQGVGPWTMVVDGSLPSEAEDRPDDVKDLPRQALVDAVRRRVEASGRMERGFVDVFTALQRAIDTSLGRDAGGFVVDDTRLSEAFGERGWQAIARWACLGTA